MLVNLEKRLMEACAKDLPNRTDVLDGVIRPVVRAVESQGELRVHTIAYGDPGTGKSTACRTIAGVLRNECGHDSVLEVDGPGMTGAGLTEILLGIEVLPLVLVLEELDKVADCHLRALLSIMDGRAEVQVSNFRRQDRRDAPILVLATANDLARVEKCLAGALSSRFTNKVEFPPLSDQELLEIALRQCRGISLPDICASDVVRHAAELGTRDPRRIKDLVVLGGPDWANGSYPARTASAALDLKLPAVKNAAPPDHGDTEDEYEAIRRLLATADELGEEAKAIDHAGRRRRIEAGVRLYRLVAAGRPATEIYKRVGVGRDKGPGYVLLGRCYCGMRSEELGRRETERRLLSRKAASELFKRLQGYPEDEQERYLQLVRDHPRAGDLGPRDLSLLIRTASTQRRSLKEQLGIHDDMVAALREKAPGSPTVSTVFDGEAIVVEAPTLPLVFAALSAPDVAPEAFRRFGACRRWRLRPEVSDEDE